METTSPGRDVPGVPSDGSQRPTIKIEQARLLAALASMQAKQAARSSTVELDRATRDSLPLLPFNPYGFRHEAVNMLYLPQDPAAHTGFAWLLELQGLGRQMASLHVEVLGDVVIGVRRPGQPPPDLDLGPYGGQEKGVSREHALLRPTRSRLYLIDLQSTNGTRLNAMPVSRGIARDLRDQDTISLGIMTFTLKIQANPDRMERLQRLAAIP